jgi:hypothetical protein
MMQQLGSSAPLRLALMVVLAVVVQFVTHASWFAIALLVTYFVAKEIVGLVQRPGVPAALLGTDRAWRIAAIACDNMAFFAALLGFFSLQNALAADGRTLGRFAAFEAAVIVFVAAWGMIGAAALRRASAVAKV